MMWRATSAWLYAWVVAEQLEALSHDAAERADSGDSKEQLEVRRRAVQLGRACQKLLTVSFIIYGKPCPPMLNFTSLKFFTYFLPGP